MANLYWFFTATTLTEKAFYGQQWRSDRLGMFTFCPACIANIRRFDCEKVDRNDLPWLTEENLPLMKGGKNLPLIKGEKNLPID